MKKTKQQQRLLDFAKKKKLKIGVLTEDSFLSKLLEFITKLGLVNSYIFVHRLILEPPTPLKEVEKTLAIPKKTIQNYEKKLVDTFIKFTEGELE